MTAETGHEENQEARRETSLVMAGHSRPKDGVLSHAYVPATHVLALVMAGLVPAIHVFAVARPQDVDARHKAGHDD